jgi:nicotinamide riboside kinase
MTMLRRVVVTGSESVGKTTLGAQLAAHYDVLCVPEYVREFTRLKGSPPVVADREGLARGQAAYEDEYLERSRALGKPLLLHDTDLASNVAYSHHYFGDCPPFIESLAIARRPDHYLLLDIDVPWIADGVRDRGDRRQEMHTLFVETLHRLGAPYTLVRGDWPQRLDAAMTVVDALLAR